MRESRRTRGGSWESSGDYSDKKKSVVHVGEVEGRYGTYDWEEIGPAAAIPLFTQAIGEFAPLFNGTLYQIGDSNRYIRDILGAVGYDFTRPRPFLGCAPFSGIPNCWLATQP